VIWLLSFHLIAVLDLSTTFELVNILSLKSPRSNIDFDHPELNRAPQCLQLEQLLDNVGFGSGIDLGAYAEQLWDSNLAVANKVSQFQGEPEE